MRLTSSCTRREALKLTGLTLGALSLSACPDDPQAEGAPLPELRFNAPVTVSGALLGVWGAPDGAEVWMVGGRVEEDGSATRHVARYERDAEGGQGRIGLHWSGPGAPLWWVWGDGQGGLWAGGEEGAILKREGDEWIEEPLELEGEALEKAIIWGIWGDKEGGVWAVGGSYRRGGPRGLLLRRAPSGESPTGGAWVRSSDPVLPTELPDDPTAGLNLFKLWGRPSGGEVWAVGEGGEALYWPEGIEEGAQRLEAPSRALMFTVHGDGDERVAVGGYGQAEAWRWRDGAWAPLSLPRGVPPLNGVSVSGPWAHLVGAMGSVTRLWLGEPGRYEEVAVSQSASGAESYTLHAAWSPAGAAQDLEADTSALPAPLFIVGGDLESRREGVILMDLTRTPAVEPW